MQILVFIKVQRVSVPAGPEDPRRRGLTPRWGLARRGGAAGGVLRMYEVGRMELI